jgi:DNA-binding response OmpR family regulator
MVRTVIRIAIASDSKFVEDNVRSALHGDYEVVSVNSGPALVDEVRRQVPDLAILDFQVGNMGGMATCLELRLDQSTNRLPHIPVLLLLDRRPDVFLARRSGAQGWLVKPLDSIRTRKAVTALLAGDDFHDETNMPSPVSVAPFVD